MHHLLRVSSPLATGSQGDNCSAARRRIAAQRSSPNVSLLCDPVTGCPGPGVKLLKYSRVSPQLPG